MKSNHYILLVPFVIGMIVVTLLLFFNYNNHKKELNEQAVRNIKLIISSFFNKDIQLEKRVDTYLEWKEYSRKETLKSVKDLKDSVKTHLKILKGFEEDIKIFDSNDFGNLTIKWIGEKGWIPIIGKYKNLGYHVNLDYLFKNYENQKFFDEVYLTDEKGEVVFPKKHLGKNLIWLELTSDSSKSNFAFQTPVISQEILLDDRPFNIFYSPLYIQGQKFYLVAAISSSKTNQLGARLDFELLDLLVFMMIITLVAIPIIGLIGFDKGDILSKQTLFLTGLALVLLSVVLGFRIASISVQEKNSHLDKIHEEKTISYFLEKNYSDVLEALVRSFKSDNWYDTTITINELKINERIQINTTGLIKKIKFDEKNDFPLDNLKLLVDDRNYSKPPKSKLFLDSHYSRQGGVIETVISERKGNTINAITFNILKIDSTKIDSIKKFFVNDEFYKMDSSKRFLLIKETGKILHKSKKIDIPFVNIKDAIPPKKWIEIEQIMLGNKIDNLKNWEINLYLDGLEYVAELKLVNSEIFDAPVWLIYLHNEYLYNTRYWLVISEAWVFISLYISFLVLIPLTTKLFNKRTNKQWTNFTYDFLEPHKDLVPTYNLLSIILIVLSSVLIFISFNTKIPQIPYLLIFPCAATFAGFLIRVGLRKQSEKLYTGKSGLSQLQGLMTGIFVIFSVNLGYSNEPTINIFLLLFFLMMLGFIKYRPNYQASLPTLFTNNLKVSYSLFFASWLFLVGFLPGALIFSKVNQNEMIVWKNETIKNIKVDQSVINSKSIDGYEKFRRDMFFGISNSFQNEINNFSAPNRSTFISTLESPIKIDWGIYFHPWYMVFGATFIFFILYSVVYFLSDKLFWLNFKFKRLDNIRKIIDFNRKEKKAAKIFLCGPVSSDCENKVNNLFPSEIIFSTEFNREFKIPDFTKKEQQCEVLHIKNFNILNDSKLVCERLSELIRIVEENKIHLIISSGMAWKSLYLDQISDTYKSIFSELFIPFHFDFVPIDSPLTIFELKGISVEEIFPKGKKKENEKIKFIKDSDEDKIWDFNGNTRISEIWNTALDGVPKLEKRNSLQGDLNIYELIFEEFHFQNDLVIEALKEKDESIISNYNSNVYNKFSDWLLELIKSSEGPDDPIKKGSALKIILGIRPSVVEILDVLTKRNSINKISENFEEGKVVFKENKELPTYYDSLSKTPFNSLKDMEFQLSDDVLLLRSQRVSKGYYFNLWSELDFEEKKVCYYYSKEGYFNYANWNTVIQLFQKGILFQNPITGKLDLFSRVFRYFILSNITPKELESFDQDRKLFGSSKNIQLALLSFIILCFALISYFDRGFFDDMTAIVTGAVGILGGIYSLFGNLWQRKNQSGG